MNILGNFKEKPNAYQIGKTHENWAFSSIQNNQENEVVQKWIEGLGIDMNISHIKPLKPKSHIEKSDFLLLVKGVLNNGVNKILKEGVSAKSGITTMHGQIYRGSLDRAIEQEFINKDEEFLSQHNEWLIKDKSFNEIDNLSTIKWEEQYKKYWNKIVEESLFGNKTITTNLLLTNLDYKDELLLAKETVLINKKQVLEDMKILSNQENVKVCLKKSNISSGIITIQRAGGSNGGKGAEDWQVRMDRAGYIKWVKLNRPESVWVF